MIMQKREAELFVLDILSDGKFHSPKSIHEQVHCSNVEIIRSAWCRLLDKGEIVLDKDLRMGLRK